MTTKQYFIVWNEDRSEGFITDERRDARSAVSGKPHRANGYSSMSTLGGHFYDTYGEDEVTVERVWLASDAGETVNAPRTKGGSSDASPDKAPPAIRLSL